MKIPFSLPLFLFYILGLGCKVPWSKGGDNNLAIHIFLNMPELPIKRSSKFRHRNYKKEFMHLR